MWSAKSYFPLPTKYSHAAYYAWTWLNISGYIVSLCYEIFQPHLITELFDFVAFIMHGVFCLKFSQHYHGLCFFPNSNDWWPELFRETPPLPFDFIININTFIHSQWLLHFSLFCPSSILCDKSYF